MTWAARGGRPAAAALAALAFALYTTTRQRALWNDGVYFVNALDRGELVYNHVLFLPLAALLRWVLAPVADLDAEDALKLLAACGGAAAVAVTFLTALATGARAPHAVAAAGLMAFLPGTWFHATASELHSVHAACAGVLLLALAGAVAQGRGAPLRAALGAFLTPASHLSGSAAVVPAAVAVLLVPGRRAMAPSGAGRWRLAAGLAAGFAAFAALYVALSWLDPDFAGYTRAYGGGIARLLPEVARLPALGRTMLAELLLPALPAVALVPAGLRTLGAARPRLAVLLAAWIAAWCAMCFRIGDAGAHGAYYVATFPAQALLAVHAFARIATTPRATFTAVALACVPAAAAAVADTWGLVAWAACATLLWAAARPGADRTADRTPLLLPVAALALSLAVLVPRLPLDPARDRVREVAAFTRPAGLVFFVETDHYQNMLWPLAFDQEPPPSFRNVVSLELVHLVAPEEAARMATAWVAEAHDRLAAGQSVWIAGPAGLLAAGHVVAPLMAELRARFRVAAPEGAPGDLLRVAPK